MRLLLCLMPGRWWAPKNPITPVWPLCWLAGSLLRGFNALSALHHERVPAEWKRICVTNCLHQQSMSEFFCFVSERKLANRSLLCMSHIVLI